MIYHAVTVVPSDKIDSVWDQCKPLIKSAIDTSPIPSNIENIYESLLNKKLELIVGFDDKANIIAILLVRYWLEREGLIAHVQAAAGNGVSSAKQEWIFVLEWFRQKKVTRIQFHCQPSQERLWRRLGFRTAYRVMWLDLQ